jgi:hypothetical protein
MDAVDLGKGVQLAACGRSGSRSRLALVVAAVFNYRCRPEVAVEGGLACERLRFCIC